MMRASVAVPLILVIGAAPGLAAVIRVPGDQATLAAGLAAAAHGDTVLAACGTYFEHDLAMPSGVVLRGESGDPSCVTVDAQGLGRVFRCEDLDASTVIAGLTITGGYAAGSENGGGLLILRGQPELRNCRITGNEAGYKGGGAYCYDSDVRFDGCEITANAAEGGGGAGIYLGDCGDAWITSCVVADNSGTGGGGLFLVDSHAFIVSCLIARNDGHVWGGGIACLSSSPPVITACTVVDNDAHYGGGIWVCNESFPLVENCLVAYNRDGSGVYVDIEAGSAPCGVTVVCSDVFGNADVNYGGQGEDQTGMNGNISDDPRFCDFEGGNYTLAADSPCLPWNNDCGALMGAYGPGCDDHTAADAPPPAATRLLAAHPNPFNPKTTLRFELAQAGAVRLAVYDAAGCLVSVLQDGVLPAGAYERVWSGRDAAGKRAASGVYFVKMDAGGYRGAGKVVLLQ